MKFNWTLKKITIVIAASLILLNSIFLISFYKFYLSNRIVDNIVESREYNNKKLSILLDEIEGKPFDISIKIIDKHCKKNNSYITLSKLNGIIIYKNKARGKLFTTSTIVNIEGEHYILTYSSVAVISGISLLKKFILYEIIIISLIIFISFIINNKRIISPMEIITKDINDYKKGIIPKKRQMPQSMQKIQNAFVDTVNSLEEEKKNQNRIIASISHDIKTPLTSVIGYTDLLKNDKLSKEKEEKYINKIYNKAIMMKDILEEFDDYQSCNIKETLKIENISLIKIEEDLINNYKDDLKDKKIKLVLNNKAKKEAINIDYIKINRIFSNVIANSVKNYNGREGIITIDIKKENNMINFNISDNGGGVKKDELNKIFNPLYTSDISRRIPGLGLSICKQIINAHDGNIYAENNKEGGLSIIFNIPLNS